MNLDEFHRTFLNHLREKSKDAANLIALDSNNEKWFQGELVLAFTKMEGAKWRVFSSECYNKFDKKAEKEWDAYVADGGIVTAEANVYKSVKVKWDKSSGTRKVDILFEDGQKCILAEIKILWLDKFKNNPEGYLSQKGLLDDAWRLRNNLYDEYWNRPNRPYLYLSLICIMEVEEKYSIKGMKEHLKKKLNDCLGEPFIADQQMEDGKIGSYHAGYIKDNKNLCSEVYEKQCNYEIHLVTIDISLRNQGD